MSCHLSRTTTFVPSANVGIALRSARRWGAMLIANVRPPLIGVLLRRWLLHLPRMYQFT